VQPGVRAEGAGGTGDADHELAADTATGEDGLTHQRGFEAGRASAVQRERNAALSAGSSGR
jgi:hypothetical protein